MPISIEEAPAPNAANSPATFEGRPLRVLMLTDCFPKPNNSTLGVWALQQALALVKNGAQVRVISPTPWLPRLLNFHPKIKRMNACPPHHDFGDLSVEYPRWPYYAVPLKLLQKHPSLFVGFAAKFLRGPLRKMIESWKPDVVFAHHTVPSGPVVLWIKKTLGIPFVTMDLDFNSIESCRSNASRRKIFAATAQQVHTATGAAKRISDCMRDSFPARSNVPLYMGAEPIDPAILSNPRPSEWAAKKVVFSAAGFYERKGIPELVKAFAIVARQRPDLILRLAGDGRCKPQIETAIAESGVADRIFLLGSLPHAQVIQEMVWSDLFMLIGWAEPFATVYLEAMSAAKPIICCDDGGIWDVLVDGREGRAVPPYDVQAAATALEELISNDALRLHMGKAAYDLFQQRLNMKATALELLTLLNAAAASRQSK